MKILDVTSAVFPEIKIIRYQKFSDNRGYFTETFRESDLVKVIPDFKIKQVNESYSKKGVFRGLHLQWNPFMGKMVRVINGRIIDFFLDIRKKSPTYGKIGGCELNTDLVSNYNHWIWVPVGFAHGIVCLEETSIEYLCTGEYNPDNEIGISPLAPDLDWSICQEDIKNKFDLIKKTNLILSNKDKNGLFLKQWTEDERSKNFVYAK